LANHRRYNLSEQEIETCERLKNLRLLDSSTLDALDHRVPRTQLVSCRSACSKGTPQSVRDPYWSKHVQAAVNHVSGSDQP
jgi:hypothetical protein